MAVSRSVRRQLHWEIAVHVIAAFVRLVVVRRDLRADFVGRRVDQTSAGRVRHGVPTFCARRTGTDESRFAKLRFIAAGEFTVL